MTLTGERMEVPADPAAFYAQSLAEQWGDGAPLLPPTDLAIEALLAGTPDPPDHVVGVLPPRGGVATVELVATNAAMAGVEPAAFPLVLAALEALLVPEWNAFGLTTTTSSVFPMLIVNGPARDDLGIDYRAGCMGGAGGRGSMTIGRAVSLCLRNIGGQRAGETTRTVFGQPARFGMCFGEWEERSPWPSLATRQGFAPDRDVVTVHGGKGTVPMADIHNDDARDLLALLAKCLASPLANMFLGNAENGEVVLAINPMWAERFGAAFPETSALQAFMHERAWQPLDLWPEPNRAILERKGRVGAAGRVYLTARPEQIVPVVCGGLGSLHAVALPSFGESQMQSVAARTGSPVMDVDAVADAVDEVGRMLRADGGDLLLVDADPKTLRVRLQLRFDDVSCADCILEPDELARTIRAAIGRRVPGEFELLVDDPASLSPVARPDTQRLWTALVDVYQPVLRDVVAALERDAGIDSGTYSALAYLDRAGGRMPLRELHDLMRVRYSQPGLSRLVQRMEADGIVARAIDPDDRRATVVSLTRTGSTRFRRAHEVYEAALDEHLGGSVSVATATSLARSLEQLAARRTPGA